MKEATGELNLAVGVAISIGILAAFFFGVLWPMINGNFQQTSQCNKAICDCSKDKRDEIERDTNRKGYCSCKSSSDATETFYCPFKG